MKNFLELAKTNLFLLSEGVTASAAIRSCLKAINENRYQKDDYSRVFYSGQYPCPIYSELGVSWKFQEARFGRGFCVEPVVTQHTWEAHSWFQKNKVEKLYVTNSGAVIFFKGTDILVSDIEGEGISFGTLKDFAYPDLMKSLEIGLIRRALGDGGIVYDVNKYKVRVTGSDISRSCNFMMSTQLETPDGLLLTLNYELLLGTQKYEKLRSTVLYNIKNVIRVYEALIEAGETPEVAIQIATSSDSAETKRRIDFVRTNPDSGFSLADAVSPGWYDGVGTINQISLSNYDSAVIAKAIGFIGEPVEPTEHFLVYRTREGAEKPWVIELSYSTPCGGGSYWLYLDGSTADAHSGNLETLSSSGDFEQYRGLLWMFLNPVKEELQKSEAERAEIKGSPAPKRF